MDDMRNTSAPLYGKAEPATTKTTMSVREMRQLLGLGKTDSYWLLHKNLFEVILINDKRRIVISSFEKWYVQMPVMDGYTATRQIRALGDPALAKIPILAMTANAFDEDRRNALESGMNGFLSKPIVIGDLVQELRKIL